MLCEIASEIKMLASAARLNKTEVNYANYNY